MAASSTIKLANTIEFASRMSFGRRSNLGNLQEPALTAANIVMQTMLAPPFIWRWNRTGVTFACNIAQTPNTQDYIVPAASFSWIESAAIQDPVKLNWIEISVKNSQSLDSNPARPSWVSAEADDSNGNITFRLMPPPDKNYNVSLSLIKKAAIFTSTQQTWAPIPDEFSHIYTWGFLSIMWLLADDPRFSQANAKFIGSLLAVQSGLTETQRNLFIDSWTASTGQVQRGSAMDSQGIQARGV